MTPKALRQRVQFLDTLTGLLHELPEAERDAATILVAWAARSIASAKVDAPTAVYLRAVDLVRKEGRCSVSWVQRKLALGYCEAARIVAEMEARGVVRPADGAKDREVLVGQQRHGRRQYPRA